jgi:hypothetical protein
MSTFALFDVVELSRGHAGLPAGTRAALVEALDDGHTWLIECVDEQGGTLDVLEATTDMFRPAALQKPKPDRPAA